MNKKAHRSATSIAGGSVAAEKARCLLFPLLAVIPFLLLPLAFVDGSLRADDGDGGALGSSITGSSMKAPKNSGGFVINLPNSGGNTQRLTYSTGLMGESLAKAVSRHLAGQLNFVSTHWGTEVTNPRQDRSGKLALFPTDGRTTIGLLLPTKDFLMGGLVAVEIPASAGSGSKKGPSLPTVVYFTITSDNLLLDVPAVIAASQAGNVNDFTLRFYDLQAQEKVRLDLKVDVDGSGVQLIF